MNKNEATRAGFPESLSLDWLAGNNESLNVYIYSLSRLVERLIYSWYSAKEGFSLSDRPNSPSLSPSLPLSLPPSPSLSLSPSLSGEDY